MSEVMWPFNTTWYPTFYANIEVPALPPGDVVGEWTAKFPFRILDATFCKNADAGGAAGLVGVLKGAVLLAGCSTDLSGGGISHADSSQLAAMPVDTIVLTGETWTVLTLPGAPGDDSGGILTLLVQQLP